MAAMTLLLLADALAGHYRTGFVFRAQYAPFLSGGLLIAAAFATCVAPSVAWVNTALRATALVVSQASAAFMPDSSSFQPCGTNAPNFTMGAERTMTLMSAFRVEDLEVRVFATAAELGVEAAADAASAIRKAVDERGGANVMFASGNSQFAFLDALTRLDDVPWSNVIGFHMDEYVGMDATHPASFARYMLERIIDLPTAMALPAHEGARRR